MSSCVTFRVPDGAVEVEAAGSTVAPAGRPINCARRSVIDPGAGADASSEK